MDIVSRFATSPLMVAPSELPALAIAVAQSLNGVEPKFGPVTAAPFAVRANHFEEDLAAVEKQTEIGEEPSIMVYPTTGMITKESYHGYMSDYKHIGLVELMHMMSAADANPNVIGHLLQIDSGGGEAGIVETTARHIRQLTKPTVAYYNGVCASAAYYLAAACDQVYASEGTDMVGSIGTVLTLWDMRQYFEDLGIKVHDIYATQSTSKNADVRAAFDGDYEPIRAVVTDPYAEAFITSVREFRPGLTSEEAFTGQVYTSAAAVELGMIDAIMPFAGAVQQLIQLTQPAPAGDLSTNPKMTKDRIEAVLGYELQASQDGEEQGIFLRTEEVEQLNDQLAETPAEPSAAEEAPVVEDQILDAQASALAAQVTALSNTVTQLSEQLAAQQKLVDRIGGKPAAGPTRIASQGDDYTPSVPAAADALETLEAQAAQ